MGRLCSSSLLKISGFTWSRQIFFMPMCQLRVSSPPVASSCKSAEKRKMVRSRCLMSSFCFSTSAERSATCWHFVSRTDSICDCISSCFSNSSSRAASCTWSCAIMSSFGFNESVTSLSRKSKTCLNFFKVCTFTLCVPISISFSRSVDSRSFRSTFSEWTSRFMISASDLKLLMLTPASLCSMMMRSRSFSIISNPRTNMSWSFFSLYSTRCCCSNSS
mmetsp:Transcript_39280/g.64853  ORF Transcript_39280/g.64853 Transcript_39280/m.64853 type:complete len:219 (+) Transcript_39280:391-1047(+)